MHDIGEIRRWEKVVFPQLSEKTPENSEISFIVAGNRPKYKALGIFLAFLF